MKDNNRIKYLSFSLWGEQLKYTVGAIRNAELAGEIYPDWRMQVYHDHTVPAEILAELRDKQVQLIDMSSSSIYAPFWRFLAADNNDCDYAIFRDTDSRLTVRECKAVNEWIRQGSVLHIMRDHPYHQVPFGADGMAILAGMWGIKGGWYPMQRSIEKFIENKENDYGIDQSFLQVVYHQFKQSQTVHDEFFEKKPFPERRIGYQFIGERIDEHDRPIGEDREILKNHLKRQRPKLLRRIKRLFVR